MSARSEDDTRVLNDLLRQFSRTRYGATPEAARANVAFRDAVNAGQPTCVCLTHVLTFMEAVNDAVAGGVDEASEMRAEFLRLQGDVKAMRRVLGL